MNNKICACTRDTSGGEADETYLIRVRRSKNCGFFFAYQFLCATWRVILSRWHARGKKLSGCKLQTCRRGEGGGGEGNSNKTKKKKLIQQYRIALGYFYINILDRTHNYYIIIRLYVGIYARDCDFMRLAAADEFLFPALAHLLHGRWFIYGGERASIGILHKYV